MASATDEPMKGACHCGAVKFTMTLSDGFNSRRRCNCSICRMRGAIAVSAKLGEFNVTTGADKLTLYQFNTGEAKHYFCSVCGIYTHHQRRSNPEEFGVNVACLDGVSPFDFAETPVGNGAQHPNDELPENYQRYVGVLKFERTKDD